MTSRDKQPPIMIAPLLIKSNAAYSGSGLMDAVPPPLDARALSEPFPTTSKTPNVISLPLNHRTEEPDCAGAPAHRVSGLSREAVIASDWLTERLAASPVFVEYRRAFETATKLPLSLRSLQSWQLAHRDNRQSSGFCTLMTQANHSRAALLRLQQQICEGAKENSCTKSYPFGIVETAVGVKVGGQTIAYLLTGQVLLNTPTHAQLRSVIRLAQAWQLGERPEAVLRSFRATRVMPRHEYLACVQLLTSFAGQLGEIANQILLQRRTAEPSQIIRARQFIEDHYYEKITLAGISRLAGMCTFYFSKKFKQVTGMNFTEYVSRIRVEHAKKLLLNQNYRVSEIGFEVGFQSLTHFNRSFKKLAGYSPKDFRRHLPSI